MRKALPTALNKHTLFFHNSRRSFLSPPSSRWNPMLLRPRKHMTTLPLHKEHVMQSETPVSFRKCLKDLQKERGNLKKNVKQNNQRLHDWELTIGIEIHALLNTERKLFSSALSTINSEANTHVAPFDLAIPGSQPNFQKEALIPAIRAALILNCKIQETIKFDRKHYFHWDQPAGYQITQYYEPYALDGHIILYAHDGIAKEDGEKITIRIKQVQLEQDTAKTISKPGCHLLDFNRVGLPLIEIITLPEIHHPKTAAALVRKIQILLNSVNACVVGMESGGLRADINISVRPRNMIDIEPQHGFENLGQKTEIKNLSSFKSIEDAIIAERDRQISVLEKGGIIKSETRGWTIGASRTKRLRDKEGEVDYRYMPDPDIAPITIGHDVISYLKSTLGTTPDEEINLLINKYNLTVKDAMTLVSLDNGGQAEFFYKVVESLQSKLPHEDSQNIGKLCSNWILHDIASLRHNEANENNPLNMKADGTCILSFEDLASLLFLIHTRKILRKPAKYALQLLFAYSVEKRPVTLSIILEEEGLLTQNISEDQYKSEAQIAIDQDKHILKAILAGNESKLKILMGMMLKNDKKGVMDPVMAEKALREVIEEHKSGC
ncbi:Glutamyl-tRNA amidotransferase subunit B, mitochondrial [Golovinomyces cichoracearum]|uniref:Glutamyl-tRNA(Gln) amidotransferase subunit B, mitochondrial n=1 Tax=Golovinomyces cichoracearum TaxID=62708 RepID=A0A420I1W5_9PEZI|nr:Glutamyl-tRNA amidotransferase subunit B, mitochondrial [Golovinomyces cichoracearum]